MLLNLEVVQHHCANAFGCCGFVLQVVVIAAGYDTRAYRLHRPGVRFYEIDLPHASRKKQELVRDLLPASKVACVNCCANVYQTAAAAARIQLCTSPGAL